MSPHSFAASSPTGLLYTSSVPPLGSYPESYSYSSEQLGTEMGWNAPHFSPEVADLQYWPWCAQDNARDGVVHTSQSNAATSHPQEHTTTLSYTSYPPSAFPLHASSGVGGISGGLAHEYSLTFQNYASTYPDFVTPLPSSPPLPSNDQCIPLPPQHISTTDRWKCPHCSYVQGRRRMVDLKRHIATHNKPSDVALWTCCGFPRERARGEGVPEDMMRAASAIHGMVGGCWETFSRRDALQRHLRKQKGRCFGDAYGTWHPGNNARKSRP